MVLNLDIVKMECIKSTTKAQQGLYEYDTINMNGEDSQLRKQKINDISKWLLKKRKIWNAFENKTKSVLLIDEIDKADIEFPNDLLQNSIKWNFMYTKLEK